MEVCGGQTHSIIRNGIDQMLPTEVELIHGPGCPVCVTPLETIDKALAIASRPEVIFCSFGDMLRVPGSARDLFQVKSEGGDVRVVYSPLDAVTLARQNPDRQVVFFGIGFETTAPANAMAVHLARRQGLENFSMLVSHVLVPPAMEAILGAPTAGCRPSWRPATSAVSWGSVNTRRWPNAIAYPSSPRALSRWTYWKASAGPSPNWKPVSPAWRMPTSGQSPWKAMRPP